MLKEKERMEKEELEKRERVQQKLRSLFHQ